MEERQYEDLVRRAQERRRMLESRRRELEQRMREREEYSGPGEPVWWDDEEEQEEQLPLREELPSPWIEEREAPIQFQAPAPAPAPPQEEPQVRPAPPMQRQKRASARAAHTALDAGDARGAAARPSSPERCSARPSPSARSTRNGSRCSAPLIRRGGRRAAPGMCKRSAEDDHAGTSRGGADWP